LGFTASLFYRFGVENKLARQTTLSPCRDTLTNKWASYKLKSTDDVYKTDSAWFGSVFIKDHRLRNICL